MADFLDFDSLEMNVDEQVNGAKEHPLKGMKTGAKMAYVGGLLFACHADDNTLQKEERSLVMGVAHSLGLGKEEVDDLAEMVVGLTDKIAYLKEIVATLKDRKTILFFLCDMIKAMGADGELNENAQKLIGAIEKLAHIEDTDKSIINSYQKILVDHASVENTVLPLGDTSSDGVDKSLLEWFAPELAKARCEEKPTKSTKAKGEKKNSSSAAKSKKSSSKTKKQVTAEIPEASLVVPEKPTVSEKLPFSQALEDAFKKFKRKCSDGTIYIGNIPTQKYLNAHESMCVQEEEHLLQHDATVWGGAREGIVFTDTALYSKGYMGVAGWRAEWADLVDCDEAWLSDSDIHVGDGRELNVVMMDESSRDPFCDLMNDILKKIKSGKYEFGC